MAFDKWPVLRSFLIDTGLFILVGVFWLCFNFDWWVDHEALNYRGFFRGDRDIGLPYSGSGTFPTFPYLIGWGLVLPVLIIILINLIVDRPWSPTYSPYTEETNMEETFTGTPLHKQPDVVAHYKAVQQQIKADLASDSPTPRHIHWAHYNDDHSPVNRKLRFLAYQLYIFLMVAMFTVIITTALKLLVLYPRPDFLDRCKPDYTKALSIDPITGWVETGGLKNICTNEDFGKISGGSVSFPSGHSSSSLCSSTFLSLFFYKRLWHRGQRTVGFIVIPFCIMVMFGFGLLIAASRHFDNRHRAIDIICGSVLGIFCGLMSLLWPQVFTPSWELDGSGVLAAQPKDLVLSEDHSSTSPSPSQGFAQQQQNENDDDILTQRRVQQLE